MNNNSILWSKILERIQNDLTSVSYRTWFENTKLYEINDNIAKILVPYPMHKAHLAHYYKDLIVSSLFEETGKQFN